MALEHNIVSVQPQDTWTQVVGDRLYRGQLFDSFEDAFGYYKDYVRRSGFDIWKATTQISKNGGGYSRRYPNQKMAKQSLFVQIHLSHNQWLCKIEILKYWTKLPLIHPHSDTPVIWGNKCVHVIGK